ARMLALAMFASALVAVDGRLVGASSPAFAEPASAPTITTVAGTGVYGFSGDSGPATSAEVAWPGGMAVDGAGNLHLDETDRGRAASAKLYRARSVAVDAAGNLYISDARAARVRKVDTSAIITTVAGGGGNYAGFAGDGGPATSAFLNRPEGIALDGTGNLY